MSCSCDPGEHSDGFSEKRKREGKTLVNFKFSDVGFEGGGGAALNRMERPNPS